MQRTIQQLQEIDTWLSNSANIGIDFKSNVKYFTVCIRGQNEHFSMNFEQSLMVKKNFLF